MKPLYKGGEKNCFKSFRPVTLLLAIGRIQEALMTAQMNDYEESRECLPPTMHGNRRGLGTTMALLEMQESVHRAQRSRRRKPSKCELLRGVACILP